MGHVHSIFITGAAKAALYAVPEVRVLAGGGLEGDRYALGTGAFSRWPGSGRAVTLIEREAIDAILRETGIDLANGQSRRNVVTEGVELASLNGRAFRIGTAVLRGARLCAPCAYLERLAGPGVFDAMKGRGGLRADVVEPGVVRVGDSVEIVPGAGTGHTDREKNPRPPARPRRFSGQV
jgi:MOSC domain-containing protein YiiM